MTERMRNIILEWAKVLGAVALITTVSSAVLSTIVALGFQLWGANLLSAAGVATSEEMESVKSKVDDLLRRVVVLARPDQVVHYRDLPVVVGGVCFRGDFCSILVFAERDIRATECRILARETELIIEEGVLRYRVPVESPERAVNLGTSPSAAEPVFRIPVSIESDSVEAFIRTRYTGCVWQSEGQPPVIQDSPRFEIKLTGPSDAR